MSIDLHLDSRRNEEGVCAAGSCTGFNFPGPRFVVMYYLSYSGREGFPVVYFELKHSGDDMMALLSLYNKTVEMGFSHLP